MAGETDFIKKLHKKVVDFFSFIHNLRNLTGMPIRKYNPLQMKYD